MNVQSWGSGSPAGGGKGTSGALPTSDGGTAGESVAAIRQGSAWALLQWSSGLLALLCAVLAVVALQANGLLVLATIFAAIYIWSVGAHQSTFWSR